jgi:hypothetical protein
MFYLIGCLCGLAIYNSTIIALNFPLALFKKLLKRYVVDIDMTVIYFAKFKNHLLFFLTQRAFNILSSRSD